MRSLDVGGRPPGYHYDAHHYTLMRILVAARVEVEANGQVRVSAPFVGGGFGPKIFMLHPEEATLPWISMRLNRPIKWIEDRLEHFVACRMGHGK